MATDVGGGTSLSPGSALSAVFAGYATWRLFTGVVRSKRVTGDVLAGVVARCRTADMPLESVDVVLTCDHPEDLTFLVSHAKRALNVIRQGNGLQAVG